MSNSRFWKVYAANLVIRSSILDVQAYGLSLTTPIRAGVTHLFMHSFSSLGEPSCAQIGLKKGTWSANLGVIGSSQPACAAYFPNQNFLGVYNSSATWSSGQLINVWSFSTTISQVGAITMSVNLRNFFDSVAVSSQLSVSTVSSDSCQLPLVSIAQQSTLFYAPAQVVKQTELLTVSAVTSLNCSIDLSNQKQWTVFLVDDSTGLDAKQMTSINSANNPTVNYNDLVIQPATLSPGLYRFVFQVGLDDSSLQAAFQASPVYTYVRVESSGIALNALYGGIKEIEIGLEQRLELNPLLYSYLLNDSSQRPLLYKNMAARSFEFFCQVVDDGVAAYGYPQLTYNNNLDLLTMQTYQSSIALSQLSTNQTCFDYSVNLASLYSFDSTGNVLTINPGSLAYQPLRQYEFLVQTTFEGGKFAQVVRVSVDQISQIPVAGLK